MSIILAIETATPVCSVAMCTQEGEIYEKRVEGAGVHSDHTFLFIQELMDEFSIRTEDLEVVLFSNGPGSYTGLRIGASAIKGLLFNQKVPLFTLSTLTSFAVPFLMGGPQTIHALIDARREHMYYQKIVKRPDQKLELSEQKISEIREIKTHIMRGDIIAGTGLDRIEHSEKLEILWAPKDNISAKNLILAWNESNLQQLFKKMDVELFEPEYLTMSQLNNQQIQDD